MSSKKMWFGSRVEPSLLDETYIEQLQNSGARPEFVRSLYVYNYRLSGIRPDWSPLVVFLFVAYGFGLLLAVGFN